VSPAPAASPATGSRASAAGVGADRPDLESMLLIRHFELALLDLFAAGEVSGTTHTCLGQEYIPVAVSGLLREEDHVFSNHRGHGHYLARFGDAEGLLAEILGREGAVCQGVGGSQHMHRPGYLSTGVQGESLPVAAGTALHLKRARTGSLACVYIGDGTWGEGSVYEALNLAALWNLPLLVVVENNGIAQSTPTTAAMAGTIAARAAAFGLDHRLVESTGVRSIRALLGDPVAAVRYGKPLVVEFVTHRVGPHSKGDDTRDAREIEHVLDRDWYRSDDSPAFREADAAARARIADIVAQVRARPAVRWQR
jgi:acetoin:2,6-dichlorophenolindophenol oxidoreductase subunit alpha